MITLGNKKVYAELEIVQLFLATIGDLCTLSRFSQKSFAPFIELVLCQKRFVLSIVFNSHLLGHINYYSHDTCTLTADS